MSLLDHLVNPSYSYGTKFKVDFRDRVNNLISLRISKKDYSGSVYNLKLTESKLVIKKNFLDEDFFLPIAGTQIEITLFSDTLSTYLEFASGSNIDYFVEVFKNQKLYAFGYLIPDTYSEDGWFAPFVTKISATDHLGFLKDFKFAYPDPETDDWTWKETQITGVEKASDIITFILNKCYLRESLVWWDLIPLVPKNALFPNWGCLQNIYFECNEFFNMTCEDVLKNILDKFNARIVQYSNGYIIQSPDERTYNKGIEYYWNGSINSIDKEFYNVYKVGGSQSEDIDARITGRTNTSIQKAVKKCILKFEKEEKKEINHVIEYLPNYPEVQYFYHFTDIAEEYPVFIATPYFFVRLILPFDFQYLGYSLNYEEEYAPILSFEVYCYSTFLGATYTILPDGITIAKTVKYPPEPFVLEYLVKMIIGTGSNSQYLYRFFDNGGQTYIDEFGYSYTPDENGFVKVDVIKKMSVSAYKEWTSFSGEFSSVEFGPFGALDWSNVKFQVFSYRYYNPETEENYYETPENYGDYLYLLVRKVQIKYQKTGVLGFNKVNIIGDLLNNKEIEISKDFIPGFVTGPLYNNVFYAYSDIMLYKDSSLEYNILKNDDFNKTDGSLLPSFANYIISKYNWYYGKNKMKVSLSIAGI